MASSTRRRVLRRTGFTLVELLVVIGIIAVLVAILLPALNRARQQAELVQCSSNMRQLGLVFFNYANSFNGHVPPTECSMPGTPKTYAPWNANARWDRSWVAVLIERNYLTTPRANYSPNSKEYYENISLLKCPTRYQTADAFNSSGYIWTYNPPIDLFGIYDETGGPGTSGVPLSRMRPAAKVVMLAETFRGDRNSPFFKSTTGSDKAQWGWDVAHMEKMSNVLYADGHVAPLRYTGNLRRTSANGPPWIVSTGWEDFGTIIYNQNRLGK